MRSRPSLAIASLALLAATLGGCGGSAGGGAGGGAGRGADADSTHEQMLEWAECLRENGLDVEDPAAGEGVQLRGQEDDVEEALQACEDREPPGEAEEDPEAAHEQMLKDARCMREHGVEEFEDPKPGSGVHADGKIFEDPDFEAAQKACMPGVPAPDQEPAP